MNHSTGATVRFASRLDPVAADMVRRVVARVGAYREPDLIEDLGSAMASPGTKTAFGVHIGDLNQALADPGYVDVLASGTHLYADGTSVRLVSALRGRHLPERLVTTDIVWPVLERAAAGGHSVYVLGGPAGLAEAASATMRSRVPGLRIVGCGNGYFAAADGPTVAERIRQTGANLVVVATGVPHQQRFCSQFGHLTGARLLLTAGGLLGYMAGRESRAPARLRAAGLEWAWRVLQDPRRLGGRYARGCLSCARLGWAALLLRGT